MDPLRVIDFDLAKMISKLLLIKFDPPPERRRRLSFLSLAVSSNSGETENMIWCIYQPMSTYHHLHTYLPTATEP